MSTPESAVKPDTPGAVIEAAPADIRDIKAAINTPTPASITQVFGDASNLVSAAPAVVEETRRGWRTSEFWVGIAAAVQAVATELPQTDKVALMALAGIYAVARGIAKNGVGNTAAPSAPEA